MKILDKKILKAYTLAELIVAVLISAIVLTVLMSFITTSMNEITFSNKQTNTISRVNDLTIQINNYRGAYSSWSILVDNSGTGSDVFLMKNSENTGWMILWVVSWDSLQLENSIQDYNTVYQKYLALRELSEPELIAVESTPSLIFDYTFNRDKIFDDIIVKDAQFELYNTWAVIDMWLDILLNYKEDIDWETWENVTNEWMYQLNLNF